MVLWTISPGAGFAQAQTTLSAEEKLEQDFNDPLTTLPQVLVRDSYTPANYGPCTSQSCVRNDETNQFIIRPLIPRIPANTLLPLTQLVRPTFTLVTVPSSRGGTRTEFGDLPMFDAAVLPWPDREKTGFLIGVGPTFVFPTATSKSAGQGAWQAGPAFGGIYTGIPGLLIGFVVQNPISFAYTSPKRPPQNTFEFQPVFALHLWDKWFLRSADANWTMGWRRHSPTMLPLERRRRSNVCSIRAAADEFLRDRTMDGLSAICADRAADHDQFRVDDRLSGTKRLVVRDTDCF